MANPASTPSTKRPASPIHWLSTAYLKKNATARITVTVPIRLIQVSPTRVSSARVDSASGSGAARNGGRGGGSTMGTGTGTGAGGAGGGASIGPVAPSRRANRRSIASILRRTDRIASVSASMRSSAGGKRGPSRSESVYCNGPSGQRQAGRRRQRHVRELAALVLHERRRRDHGRVVRRELRRREVDRTWQVRLLRSRAKSRVRGHAAGDDERTCADPFGRHRRVAQQFLDHRALERSDQVQRRPRRHRQP